MKKKIKGTINTAMFLDAHKQENEASEILKDLQKSFSYLKNGDGRTSADRPRRFFSIFKKRNNKYGTQAMIENALTSLAHNT